MDTRAEGIWNTLEIRRPGGVLFHGPEGRWCLTRRGATLFLVGPLVLMTLAAALAWAATGVGAFLFPVPFLTGAALLLQWQVRKQWAAGALRRRVCCATPGRGSPRACTSRNSARMTPHSSPAWRWRRRPAPSGRSGRRCWPRCSKHTEDAVVAGVGPPGCLAALRRLMVEDAVAFGADPVPLVADQLARCFEGRLPLVYAERLLAGWRSPWWTAGALVRLRVLLCDRAFEAAFEVSNLLDAGQTAPSLGEVLRTDDPAGLAALRRLWSQRPTRPWDQCGPAHTVFDLAADPAHAGLLGRRPDLLLWQREPEWVIAAEDGDEPMRAAEIALCAGGLWLQEVRFTAPPAVVEETYRAFGGTLVLGGRRFRGAGAMDALARRMDRWFRFAFAEFLPRTAEVADVAVAGAGGHPAGVGGGPVPGVRPLPPRPGRRGRRRAGRGRADRRARNVNPLTERPGRRPAARPPARALAEHPRRAPISSTPPNSTRRTPPSQRPITGALFISWNSRSRSSRVSPKCAT